MFSDYFTDKPAVLVERSVPIGPSFSFPSMPSFPLTAGFLSFFSWKGEDKASKAIFDATSEAAKQNTDLLQEESKDKSVETSSTETTSTAHDAPTISFMSTILNYFSKGGPADNKKVAEAKDIGIITWDPLREQTREQLLALRDDLNRTLESNPSMENLMQNSGKRPPMKIRSKTYNANNNSLFSSSLEHDSDGSVVDNNSRPESPMAMTSSKSHTTINQKTRKPERIALRKTFTEQPHQRQHLVEVLGIDGVRVDSFERARVNFDKHEKTDTIKEEDESSDKHHHKKKVDKEDGVNGSGGNNLWLDLNTELNKPGPAITSPGESRADVAQDATVPKSSDTIDEDAKKTDIEEEKLQEKEELNKLPGKCRMDYVLQPDSVMSMIANEYLIGLRAHFSYWTNKDLLWHMLRRIENLDELKKDELLNTKKNKSNNPLLSTSNSDKTVGSSKTIISVDDRNMVKKNKK